MVFWYPSPSPIPRKIVKTLGAKGESLCKSVSLLKLRVKSWAVRGYELKVSPISHALAEDKFTNLLSTVLASY